MELFDHGNGHDHPVHARQHLQFPVCLTSSIRKSESQFIKSKILRGPVVINTRQANKYWTQFSAFFVLSVPQNNGPCLIRNSNLPAFSRSVQGFQLCRSRPTGWISFQLWRWTNSNSIRLGWLYFCFSCTILDIVKKQTFPPVLTSSRIDPSALNSTKCDLQSNSSFHCSQFMGISLVLMMSTAVNSSGYGYPREVLTRNDMSLTGLTLSHKLLTLSSTSQRRLGIWNRTDKRSLHSEFWWRKLTKGRRMVGVWCGARLWVGYWPWILTFSDLQFCAGVELVKCLLFKIFCSEK